MQRHCLGHRKRCFKVESQVERCKAFLKRRKVLGTWCDLLWEASPRVKATLSVVGDIFRTTLENALWDTIAIG